MTTSYHKKGNTQGRPLSAGNTRDYKEFSTGEHYHLYNRGNDKMDIFRDAQDYSVFLQRLSMALGKETQPATSRAPLDQLCQGAPLTATAPERSRVRVTPFESGTFSLICYCLMPNHFHLLLRQEKDTPLSALLLKVLTSYSMYFNRKYQHVGHVFQDRFRAVHIGSDTQLKHISAYIHLNPKVATFVRDAAKWKYSSYPEYLTQDEREMCDKTIVLEQFRNARDYERFVQDSFEDIRERKNVARELMLDE